MSDDLLGYVCRALEAPECDDIERRMAQDPQLKCQLESIQKSLAPLAADVGHLQPPADLAARTCNFVAAKAYVCSLAAGPCGGAWNLQDLVVAAGVLAAATMLFVPALNHSRYGAQAAVCQNNFRELGRGLLSYADAHGGMLPAPASDGRLAFAGVFAPTLASHGVPNIERLVQCPGDPGSLDRNPNKVTLADLDVAGPAQLSTMQRESGGSYAYNLGYRDAQGRLLGARNRSRANFALMADAPCPKTGCTKSVNHGRRGQNVLFGDGHADFLTDCRYGQQRDDYYHNEDGEIAAGNHEDDAVLAESATPPLVFANQR